VLVTDDPSYGAALAPHRGASLPDVEVTPDRQFLLLFTSGTSGAPKAVICTQGRWVSCATASSAWSA
jgi:fatty-acyl-CoA synthase